MISTETIAANLSAVRERIAAACRRAQRDPREITLVCASKTVPTEAIRIVHACGARVFGENYGQELRDKVRALSDLADTEWHFIGPLQRNKVKYVAGTARLIHTLHSLPLLEVIDRSARQPDAPMVQEVLVQLNLADEPTKSGFPAEALEGVLDAFAVHQGCRCVGLMTMPPLFDDPERSRPYFTGLRRLRDRLSTKTRPGVDLRHLSMGMSGDFEVAIEEGATLVRIGTAIFGSR